MGERCLRPPGEVTGARDQRSRQERADGQEVLEPFGGPPLRDAQAAAGEAKRCRDQRSALNLRVERRKGLLCRFEPALLDERFDEQGAVQYPVGGRRR